MEPFEIQILGCGSALPTTRHNASSQVVRVGNRWFMIDCGEGTQQQLRKQHISFSQISSVFISHLHGDHCFGLIGMISSFSLLGRTAPLHIYADKLLRQIMKPQLDFFCKGLPYKLIFHDIDATSHTVIYEDNAITVETIPQEHRLPCCGFLFREKPKKRHIIGEMMEFYKVPEYLRRGLKDGNDFITPDGVVIPNERLTREADPSRSYAYCSDTLPCHQNIKYIRGVDLLYHEATFAESEKVRAKETFHTTARQAAEIARNAHVGQLIIGHFSSRYNDDNILLDEAREIFPATEKADESRIFGIK